MERENVPVDSHYKNVILRRLYKEWQKKVEGILWMGIDPYFLIRKYDEKTQLGLNDVVRNVTDLIERKYVVSKGDPKKQSRRGLPWEFVDITPQGRELIESSKLDSVFPARKADFGTEKYINH